MRVRVTQSGIFKQSGEEIAIGQEFDLPIKRKADLPGALLNKVDCLDADEEEPSSEMIADNGDSQVKPDEKEPDADAEKADAQVIADASVAKAKK